MFGITQTSILSGRNIGNKFSFVMSFVLADNILSPLGFNTEENVTKIMLGESSLHSYEKWNLPEPFVASLFSDVQRNSIIIENFSWFESVVISSVKEAVEQAKKNQTDFSLSNKRTIFILSTTKANVGDLQNNGNYILPGESAQRIAFYLGITTSPIVVCNACVSGLSAMALGDRLITTGQYDYAIVCGADVQSRFIISGFQSLKALSPNPCRPFDIERIGLNLGEAAATIILSSKNIENNTWCIVNSAASNDAFHITTPARKGDGLKMVIEELLSDSDENCLAMINAHGTATLFNDQMESVALRDAGLQSVPVNALKGYLGHTMGAAGVLETIITMQSLQKGECIGTKGFEELGVSGKINIVKNNVTTEKRDFIKFLSGFGGCNVGIYCSDDIKRNSKLLDHDKEWTITHTVEITSSAVNVDGVSMDFDNKGVALLAEIYKKNIGDYPKFYKMDYLCKLGFVASELLIKAEGVEMGVDCENRGVILFNSSSSTETDMEFCESISNADNYFPSPSTFVYTLPNILAGEISIRNNYHGETCLYILPEENIRIIKQIIDATFCQKKLTSIITGWIDYNDVDTFIAKLSIIKVK